MSNQPFADLPAYRRAVEALQDLATITGRAWIITNLDLGDADPEPPVVPAWPWETACLFCGRVH